MFHQAFSAAAKIFLKPNVDARHLELAVLDSYAPWVVDVLAGAFLEQRFGILTRVRSGLQVGATQARAVDRVVNSVVVPDRPQNAMLDVIEGKFFFFDNQ